MKASLIAAGAMLLFPAVGVTLPLLATAAYAHRLDEYLQATTISVGKDRVQAQIRLTPGVAVVPRVLAVIDSDADGIISDVEQRRYAERVLRDLSLTADGKQLHLRLVAAKFADVDELKAGRGDIRIDFDAAVPLGGSERRLIFENHHQSGIAVYLVNALVPRDPGIRVTAQNRNYRQSFYQLDYVQAGAGSAPRSFYSLSASRVWLGALAVLSLAQLALVRRRGGAATRSIDHAPVA